MTIDSLINQKIRQDSGIRRVSQEHIRDRMRAYHIREYYGQLHRRQYKSGYNQMIELQRRGI